MIVHRRVAVLALPLIIAACAAGGGTSTSTSSNPPTAPAVLNAALLTLSDLPNGFTVAPPHIGPKYTYDPAACGEFFTDGAVPTGPHTAAAAAEFRNVSSKSRVVEVLYHSDDPVAHLKTLRQNLGACRRFTFTDPSGRRSTAAGEITTEPTSTGAFVEEIAVSGAATGHETVAAQLAGTNVVLLVITGPTPPDSEETTYLVRAAVARAQHA